MPSTQIRITDLQIPPPHAFAGLESLQFLIDLHRVPLLVDTPHPNAICLLNYPTGFIDRLPHWMAWRTYYLPYYGRSLEIAIVSRAHLQTYLERDQKLIPLIYHNGNFNHFKNERPKTMTKTAPAKNTTAAAPAKTNAVPKSVKPGQGLSKAPQTNPTSIFAQPKYVADLVPSYTGADGKKREIGFMELTVGNMLNWLKSNHANRPINWAHVKTLMDAWLTDWVDDANLYICSYLDEVADGQHRPIAFVLAFGNRDQVSDLLRMIGTWSNSGWSLSKEIDGAKLMGDYVPIKNYKLSGISIAPGRYIPVLRNADPRVADKADTDQRKRTGADQLTRHSDSSGMLAKWGLSGAELQTILRYMYLRVLPPTEAATEAVQKVAGPDAKAYGSIRKSGNIHPDRYPILAKNFNTYIESAMDLIHSTIGYTKNLGEVNKDGPTFLFDHYQLIGTIALAVQGQVPVDTIRGFINAYVIPAGMEPAADSVNGILYNRKKGKTLVNANVVCYIVSRFIQEKKNPNPKIAGTTQLQREEALLLSMGDDKYEQQALNRLPGWDSEGCKDILSQSLKNKIRANELKKERTQKLPPKK